MRRLLTSGIFVVFCFLTVTILAQVPQLLNYQGRLTDDAGIPIITTTTLRFSLYQGGDAATPGSGTLCYQEDASVTPDDNGVFSYLIGSGTVIFGTLDSTVFQTASPVYLEIAIDPAGANETLLPRKQIVTVGYSFKSELADDADTVDGQEASAFAPVVHNHDPDYVNEGQTDSVNSAMIVNGTIVDADINAGANIAGSKIDPTGLDADLLDGKDSEAFVHTAGDDMTGTLTINTSSSKALTGTTSNTSGIGVYGKASATGGTNYGVYGKSDSYDGRGVYGQAPAIGVYGFASYASGSTYGVYGRSDSAYGSGVFGYATAASGYNYGVFGRSDSLEGRGVYGFATSSGYINYGVYGESWSTEGYGVYGINTAGGYVGYFDGKVHVTGDFTVGGAKTCVQPIDNGKKVLLYAMESPEIWFEDFGSAQLVNGQAVVPIEKIFAQTANIEMGYLIFLTPIGECNGLYISRKDKNSFEVRELGGGTSNISFNYRIVAKRRGYEEVRFEEFTEPEQPPEQPNLPIAPKETKLKQPQSQKP
ncbi:MAG: hypothetical protein OEZ30_04380 [Candidatus Aminicenantes bacterium]|nr:hypothetical protein [Candidatus Aminicenantes bacterium]MDH5714782.1 hypothetical protein [Candidatus Aminicenantes bacterium]